jgi:hypothetical protein
MSTPGFGAPSFGQPQVDTPSESPVNGSAAGAGDQVQEFIDPNDPRLTSEALDVNLEGDAYAFPPPPPDGKYRAKLKLAPPKDASGKPIEAGYIAAKWGRQQPQLVLVTGVEASIIDPNGKHDGIKLYDFNVATFMGRDNSSKVQTILKMLRQPSGEPWVKSGTKLTHKDWMLTLHKALAGEPEIGVETQWEWNCEGCGKAAKASGQAYPKSITGMRNFPQDHGKPVPEMRCSKDQGHGVSKARATIARFVALSEIK